MPSRQDSAGQKTKKNRRTEEQVASQRATYILEMQKSDIRNPMHVKSKNTHCNAATGSAAMQFRDHWLVIFIIIIIASDRDREKWRSCRALHPNMT